MAEDAYIKVAAKQVRDAVAALQKEIHQTQREAYDDEQRLHLEISNTEYQANNLKAEYRAKETFHYDDSQKKDIQNRIQQLEALIGEKKQATKQRDGDAAKVVKSKTDLMNQLSAIASQLESLVGAARS